ncbi:hypothetical protein DES53_11582 [Roseimicrobium gellanilyticum]|uniref:Uncharacterized protein n=1 Tax=Roseimicrobium gellanilyticum TaxID=748857 RepID=A0A366H649_9BACT|nr:hypothetical protein DES53_11582 [Roseimicrobium gellanilyticum]
MKEGEVVGRVGKAMTHDFEEENEYEHERRVHQGAFALFTEPCAALSSTGAVAR